MLTSEVLDLAADLIEERGWEQFSGWGEEGAGLCLEGGIVAALGLDYRRDQTAFYACPAYGAVWDYLQPYMAEYPSYRRESAYDWNDQQGRTKAEVIAVLRAASVVVSARESQPAAVSS